MVFVFMKVYVITKGQFLEQERRKQGEEKHERKAEGLGRCEDSLERGSVSRPTGERISEKLLMP